MLLFYIGDCSEQKQIEEEKCRFTHSWISNSANISDVEDLGLVHGIDVALRRQLKHYAKYIVFSIVIVVLSIKMCKPRKREVAVPG